MRPPTLFMNLCLSSVGRSLRRAPHSRISALEDRALPVRSDSPAQSANSGSNLFHGLRLPSLLLAAVLQLAPITRAALPVMQSANQVLAIVFRWAAGIAAAMGSIQAVSGASTTVNSAKTAKATNGVPFSFRVTTSPDQAGYWTATGLPPGLALSGTAGKPLWQIKGTPTLDGVYRVSLTAREKQNSTGNRVTTGTLTITVLPGASPPPSITTQPQDLTVNEGQTAAFAVEATGPPLAYLWRFNGQSITGQTGASLSVANTSAASAGGYDVIVSNTSGSVTSRVAQLTVVIPPPEITAPPVDQSVVLGNSATFNVTATGSSLSYQWRKNTEVLAGETSASLILSNVTALASGAYDVVVANSAGSITSQVAQLTVLIPPTITTQPAGTTIEVGNPVVLTVSAIGTDPLTYQWQRDDQDLPGKTEATLDLGIVALTDGGTFRVIVSNAAGSVTSDPAVLVVKDKATVVAPQFAANRFEAGKLVAEFQGAAGATYAVERSLDLLTWEQTSTSGPSTTGGTLVVELETSVGPAGFLRLRVLP